MRDVVTGFYTSVLERLIDQGAISISDSVLIVCGGPLDEGVARKIGFKNCTITNIDSETSAECERQDVENLSYENQTFDIVIVHAGLHHCYSPHRALLEMYRVARKCIIAFESRDSILMRTAVRLGLTLDYEINSVTEDGRGGVAESGVPNFIYRWTERDVRKTIASFDPVRIPSIKFFYDLRIPIQRFTQDENRVWRAIGTLVEPMSKIFAKLFPSQCNEFAFTIFKKNDLHPWINQ